MIFRTLLDLNSQAEQVGNLQHVLGTTLQMGARQAKRIHQGKEV